MGADDEAKQHIVALADRLHQFGNRTKERNMELWHRLSSVMDLPGMEQLLARNQQIWSSEYDKFVEKLTVFVNKEISDFRHSIVSIDDSLRDYQIYLHRVCESV